MQRIAASSVGATIAKSIRLLAIRTIQRAPDAQQYVD